MLLPLPSRFSRVRLCATPETAAHEAPPSLGFSRQEHWSGLPFHSPMYESEKWKWSRSVVSDSSRLHGLQPTRLLRPWDFPGKSTGVGCHHLLRFSRVINSKYSPLLNNCETLLKLTLHFCQVGLSNPRCAFELPLPWLSLSVPCFGKFFLNNSILLISSSSNAISFVKPTLIIPPQNDVALSTCISPPFCVIQRLPTFYTW